MRARKGLALLAALLGLAWLPSCSAPAEGPLPTASAGLGGGQESTPTAQRHMGTPTASSDLAAEHERDTEAVPAAGTVVPGCALDRGRRIRGRYDSRQLGEWVAVNIYLPPCYEEDGGPYPVLYLLHGKPQDERHWELLGVIELVEDGIGQGSLPPLVLAMPNLPEPLFSGTDGGPGSYEEEFLSALMPYIEANYAVMTDREGRGLAGISRGAVWALEIGLRHPEAFGAVAALSPALNLNRAREAYDPLQIAEDMGEGAPRVFLGVGDADSALNGTRQLRDRLRASGAPHALSVVPGTHDGTTWRMLLPEMLRYLAQDW